MSFRKLKIGTRGSKLALKQAEMVKQRIVDATSYPIELIEIVTINTIGDLVLDRNISEIGVKGVFTKEIEEALISNEIDLAVHSLKDMPAVSPEGLHIAAVLERGDPRDALLGYDSIKNIPKKAVVGTSSLRRAAQILKTRPDLSIIPFRGNVQTRINKLNSKVVDCTLLAASGLKRLEIEKEVYSIIEIEEMIPAAAQGIIAVEASINNDFVNNLLSNLNHEESFKIASCERIFLKRWEELKNTQTNTQTNSCQTPIAAHACFKNGKLEFKSMVASLDLKTIFYYNEITDINSYDKIGKIAAEELANKLKS